RLPHRGGGRRFSKDGDWQGASAYRKKNRDERGVVRGRSGPSGGSDRGSRERAVEHARRFAGQRAGIEPDYAAPAGRTQLGGPAQPATGSCVIWFDSST